MASGALSAVLPNTPLVALAAPRVVTWCRRSGVSASPCLILFDAGLDARSFAIVVLIGASCSFLSPIGHQTNLMVYGPGGCKFRDFTIVGASLSLVTSSGFPEPGARGTHQRPLGSGNHGVRHDGPMSERDPDPELLAAAQAIHLLAYCPYSHYRVGAAIRTSSGAVMVGCNVENAAYPLGSCAEAGAIAAMVAAGERSIAEIVVVTDGDVPGTPCGGCRQRIREFAGPAVPIHSVTASASGASWSTTMADLLPHSFGPEFLGVGGSGAE